MLIESEIMTAQLRERLLYKNQEYEMAAEPLNEYLSKLPEKNIFFGFSTDCWRGYIGNWEIRDDKLFLVKLTAYHAMQEVNVEILFPGQNEVFAEWFNGELRIPCGELLRYVHMGYSSIYEEDLFLEFENGILKSRKIVDNRDYIKRTQADYDEFWEKF
jgi:hypothetical protein